MELDKKEAGIAALKSLFSAIPYAGQLLNEVFFEYRGRIKQNRLNHFTTLMTDFFISNPDIRLENLKSEDFIDLFESIIIKVANAKSHEKHRRFRDILTQHIINPQQTTDNAEIYLQLVVDLNEDSINILKQYQIFKVESDKVKQQREKLNTSKSNLANELLSETSKYPNNDEIKQSEIEAKIVDIETQHEAINTYITSIQSFKKAEFYNIPDDEFLYNKQMLASKALLLDNGMSFMDTKPFEAMTITEFGNKFINFIIQ